MVLSYIPRVTQLDAVQLDTQLEELFKQLLFEALKYLEPGTLQPILPELELLIRSWIFGASIVQNKATFGQQMLLMKYKSDNFSRSKLCWYYGYTIGLKYLKERAFYSWTSKARVQNAVNKLEKFQAFVDILNFLRFIQSGKYPVVIDFILGLELKADKLTREDLTDLSWTREILWHNFIVLITTAISLVNLFGLNKRLPHILKYVWWRKPPQSSVNAAPATMTVNTVCALCSNNPILPHTMGCQHIFCYYCLMSSKTADEDFLCPKCYFGGKQICRYVVVK